MISSLNVLIQRVVILSLNVLIQGVMISSLNVLIQRVMISSLNVLIQRVMISSLNLLIQRVMISSLHFLIQRFMISPLNLLIRYRWRTLYSDKVTCHSVHCCNLCCRVLNWRLQSAIFCNILFFVMASVSAISSLLEALNLTNSS